MLNDLHNTVGILETPQMFVACREYGSKQSIRKESKYGCGMSKLFETPRHREKERSRSWFTR